MSQVFQADFNSPSGYRRIEVPAEIAPDAVALTIRDILSDALKNGIGISQNGYGSRPQLQMSWEWREG